LLLLMMMIIRREEENREREGTTGKLPSQTRKEKEGKKILETKSGVYKETNQSSSDSTRRGTVPLHHHREAAAAVVRYEMKNLLATYKTKKRRELNCSGPHFPI